MRRALNDGKEVVPTVTVYIGASMGPLVLLNLWLHAWLR